MPYLERIESLGNQISDASRELQSIQRDKMCAQMAERNYSLEMSVLNQKETEIENKLDNLFSEIKQVYRKTKGA